ncbi:hypothetical protein CkaCkLH20_11464 [Colletotrichum karsti]|uniref:Uncharacterized protein n=1 Tax=Colletotrichum karsti TaxID=1095194 RepID=A0A9P6HU43_9PEZI|nr:uncharacterized protein CkaCkLH20_11464 [Colletotrichum karsti]KAF9871047.1 hypothetical protein CkaCkLH20_11464 [Colletotrichum karsti]
MPCSNADRNLWLAYANAVKEASGFEPDHNVAMYLARNARKGPFISSKIPTEYINARIYEACDNRLSPDNLFYDPTSRDSYTRHLMTYLASVDVGARGEVAHEIKQRFQDFEAALGALDRSREKAFKTFRKHSETRMTGDLTFSQWHQTNAPAFCNAISNVEAASAALLSAGSVLIGPAAQRWNQDLRKIIDALTSDQSVPGISMMAEHPSASKDQELLNAVLSRKKAPAAKNALSVPAYYSPEYEDVVKDWIKAGPNEELCDEFYVRYAEGEIADEGGFGQEAREGELDYDYPPWISFHMNGRDEVIKTEVRDGDIDITLRFEKIKILAVSSGAW